MKSATELSWPWRFGVAVLATGLMLLSGILMSRSMGGSAPLILFILPVLVSAWCGGLGSGLLATLLGGIFGSYFFLAPFLSWTVSEPFDRIRLGIFLVAGATVSWLASSLRQARTRTENAARRAEQRQEELERQIAELARVEEERKGLFEQLATERARFQAVVENMPAGVVVAEAPSGRVVLFNPQAEKVLGHPVIPTSDIDAYEQWPAYHPDGRRYERHEYTMVRALQGEVVRDREFLYRQSDGTMRWRRASATPIRGAGGEIQGAISLVYDIDAEKRMEESLRLQTVALQEADRRKDEFLAILAHELRNPLAPIHNSLQILALRADDPAAVEKARELMERQVQQMIRMVDDLLEVSRIARGKVGLRKETVDLAGVVATAVETSRPGIETRRHELTVELPERPIYVDGDPARLAQVLTNLLNNAAKYTEVGGRIGLRIERNGREGTEAVLRVRDNGIGIAPEMLPRVFDMFAQAEGGMERAQGGLGIGLTLVRSLVEMHGGTVEAASDGLGKGSELVVRLPALPEEAAAAGQPSPEVPEAAAAASRRILVVDDNVDSAESLALLLQLYGHQARLAHDGVTGLEEARSFLPDVVLLDIGLPRLDGYSVARRLRQEPGLDHVTLIAMTGYGQEEDRRRSKDAGFDHHLVKPVDLDTLRGLLAAQPAGL
ncbi:MAG TPA: ATP-binding protein [Thermoanaerobaculia bacterium]|nr:ATP-binding protein [Thermoanaerobaculia bacterium]